MSLQPLAWVAVDVQMSRVALPVPAYAPDMDRRVMGATDQHLARGFPSNRAVSLDTDHRPTAQRRVVQFDHGRDPVDHP